MNKCLLIVSLFVCVSGQAQYKSAHLPGLVGLQGGTQAPPGLYVGNIVYVYPTSTVKDSDGRKINQTGELTSTADMVFFSWVTNAKLFGANIGGQVAIPFITNRLQLNALDVRSGLAFTDMFVTPLSLGWHTKRADVIAGYNLYIPTGRFSPGATDNTGLGMVGNEFFLGSTAYLDQKKSWSASAVFSYEFNTEKRGTNIKVGDLASIEYGLGKAIYKKTSGPIPMIFNIGAAGYSQFKVTNDSGSDVPVPLRGFKDRVFALGPEFSVFIPQARLTLLARYQPEFGTRVRTQGQTIVFSLAWVAKSLAKQPAP